LLDFSVSETLRTRAVSPDTQICARVAEAKTAPGLQAGSGKLPWTRQPVVVARQIKQINLPALTKVGQFYNGAAFDPAYDILVVPFGAIYVPDYAGHVVNVWPRGEIRIGVDDYWASRVAVRATPAS